MTTLGNYWVQIRFLANATEEVIIHRKHIRE